MRPPGGGDGRRQNRPYEVSTDPEAGKTGHDGGGVHRPPPPSPAAPSSASACEPYRDFIEPALAQGRNAMAIWQDLVDDHGFRGRATRACGASCASCAARRPPEARVGDQHRPGRRSPGRLRRRADGARPGDGQVPPHAAVRSDARLQPQVCAAAGVPVQHADLGRAARARLPPAGRRRRASSCSTTCARACSSPTSTTPRSIRSTATCSRTTASSRCRAASRDPDRKGKVESGVGHAKKTPLKGLRFESLEEAQAYLDRWEERWADTRIHGTTKRQVAAMFAEEKPALLPLPLEPFRYYQYGERTVHLDGCVEVEAAYYGAPPGWIGRRVQVQWDEPARAPARPQDGPAAARAPAPAARRPSHPGRKTAPRKTPLGTEALLAPRRQAGRHIGALCQQHPPQRGRGWRCAASWACSRWPRSTAPPPSTTPAPPPWRSALPELPLRAPLPRAPARRRSRCARSIRSSASSPSTATSSTNTNQEKTTMNLIELDRALRQLRLGGMADVLETRLLQAQAEAMAPIDLLSCLVSDELTRRADRLLDGAANRPASAIPTRPSTTSTSPSTRR